MLICEHDVTIPAFGDFQIDHKFIFEIGGAKKSFDQIPEIKNIKSFVASDDIESGIGEKIPLWLFGFLY